MPHATPKPDQRIGEILRELPKSNKWASNSSTQEVETKADAIANAGISKSQAYDLQVMAANPEVVEAVIAKAENAPAGLRRHSFYGRLVHLWANTR